MKRSTSPLAKLIALTCVLALVLSLIPAAWAAGSNRDSGSTSLPKLSKEEITQLLRENPNTMPDQVFDVTPSVTAPYSIGQVSSQALQRAVDRLNALRRIAGLPSVTLDASLCENAQYGAVLTAANGGLSHSPSKPADMDESFYKQGYSAASSSNLYAGVTLTFAPDGFMDDSDSSNISRVGHRRWQLNPTLGKVGFGYAQSSSGYGRYVTEKVFDRSGSGCDYDFIAWPASGNFPANTGGFETNTAWSVTLNPQKYAIPSLSQLTITLVRESDGKSWVLSGNESYNAGAGRYLNVNTGNYGVANCIIFRPDNIDRYEGVYTVTIDGLKSKSGSPAAFSYQVDFFDPDTYNQQPVEPEEPEEPEKPVEPERPSNANFADVPAASWFAPYVTLATKEGLMTGTGSNTFTPNGNLTLGQTMVLAYQLHSQGKGTLPKVSASSPWYAPYYQYCVNYGIVLPGVGLSQMDRKATRYEMVALLHQAVPASQLPAINDIPDGFIPDVDEGDPYGPQVYTWYRAGALSGGTNYRFNGSSNITRAEVCVILCQVAGLVDRVTINVPRQEVTNVSLTLAATSLQVGESTTGSAAIYPSNAADKTLTWSSSDPSVATVTQSGRITAQSAGTAVITVTAKNGVKDSAVLTVTKPVSIDPQAMAEEVVRLVNAERAKEGLSPLSISTKATQGAQIRAQEILTLFDHTRPDGSSFSSIFKDMGISYYTAGENIAMGYPSPEAVVAGWMNSPGHRANILNANFNAIGVGYAPGNAWVQLFIGSSEKEEGNTGSNSGNSSGNDRYFTKESPLPADGCTDYYRQDWEGGQYMGLKVTGKNTVQFSGCVKATPGLYNYALLWVAGGRQANRAEMPFTSMVSFQGTAVADLNALERLYTEDPNAKSHVSAMICQNYTPGDSAFGGFTFRGVDIFLVLDESGSCQLKVEHN